MRISDWSSDVCSSDLGALFGLLHAAFSVTLGVSQHVTGIGITLLAASLSYFAFRMLLPNVTTPPKIEPFRPYPIPGLSEIPYVGEVLITQSPLTYLAFALVPAVGYGLYRTPLGLALRMVGENPLAVEAQGIDVHRLHTGAVMLGSAFMAVGGAFLTISVFAAFYIGMLNGRGCICLALVIFASWRPAKALAGALPFVPFPALQPPL